MRVRRRGHTRARSRTHFFCRSASACALTSCSLAHHASLAALKAFRASRCCVRAACSAAQTASRSARSASVRNTAPFASSAARNSLSAADTPARSAPTAVISASLALTRPARSRRAASSPPSFPCCSATALTASFDLLSSLICSSSFFSSASGIVV